MDDASALEETLTRLRQRYALHFNSADTSASSTHRTIQVDLTDAARRRYPDAEIHYRRVSISGNSREAGPISITRAHLPDEGPVRTADAGSTSNGPANGVDDLVTPKRRRMAVDQSYGSGVNVARDDSDSSSPTPSPAPGK